MQVVVNVAGILPEDIEAKANGTPIPVTDAPAITLNEGFSTQMVFEVPEAAGDRRVSLSLQKSGTAWKNVSDVVLEVDQVYLIRNQNSVSFAAHIDAITANNVLIRFDDFTRKSFGSSSAWILRQTFVEHMIIEPLPAAINPMTKLIHQLRRLWRGF